MKENYNLVGIPLYCSISSQCIISSEILMRTWYCTQHSTYICTLCVLCTHMLFIHLLPLRCGKNEKMRKRQREIAYVDIRVHTLFLVLMFIFCFDFFCCFALINIYLLLEYSIHTHHTVSPLMLLFCNYLYTEILILCIISSLSSNGHVLGNVCTLYINQSERWALIRLLCNARK